jgi:MAF protein
MENVSFLLASNSPRRKQMLSWMGIPFRVKPTEIDETPYPEEHPAIYVRRLAVQKAMATRSDVLPDEWIIAADTIVADGAELLGKPMDEADARRMLLQLRGKVHQVYSALAIIPAKSIQTIQDICREDVRMRNYTDEEIDAYIATGDPLDKAGAYAIQHPVFKPVEDMKGCFACIMGLPLCHLTRTLTKAGLQIKSDIPALCQQNLTYTCPVHSQVLAWQSPYLAMSVLFKRL